MIYGKYYCGSCSSCSDWEVQLGSGQGKRSGVKCVGCPAGGKLPSRHKKKKKKLTGAVIAKKTIIISGMHCAHCVQSVTDSLNRIERQVSARVDLISRAEIFLDREVGEDILISAVEKEGFLV